MHAGNGEETEENMGTVYPICPKCKHETEAGDIPSDRDMWHDECPECGTKYVVRKMTYYSTWEV